MRKLVRQEQTAERGMVRQPDRWTDRQLTEEWIDRQTDREYITYIAFAVQQMSLHFVVPTSTHPFSVPLCHLDYNRKYFFTSSNVFHF